MKIKLAMSSGFCMGVRRAVELALEAVHNRPAPIYSYGPLIHNPQAMNLLAAKGLVCLDPAPHALEGRPAGAVIIRAHGVPPDERREISGLGFDIIDATCPRVIRVQAIIARHAAQGYDVIIWGNPTHPEVVGLLGHAGERGLVIESAADVAALPDLDRVILTAQTTQNLQQYDEVIAAVRGRWPEALVFETICGATQRRQQDVRQLARDVEAMVVVGGHDSGNTRRLAQAAQNEGARTTHIETEDELEKEWFDGVSSVGITAGASTPNWMIKRVIREVERLARPRNGSVAARLYSALRMLLLSNIYAAAGAGMLCLAGSRLQRIEPEAAFFGVTFFYVYAMHVLNLFLDKEASQFNDPDRARFLERFKTPLLASGALSGVVGLALGLSIGPPVFALLAVMSTLGLLYAVPVLPAAWSSRVRFRRLKDIPTSKTFSLAGGWAMTLALVPALAPHGRLSPAALFVWLFIFLLVFIRSALGDVREIQGDRIVGRETIPIIIGEEPTLRLLQACAAALVLLLAAGTAAGLIPSLGWVLLACAGYAAGYLYLFRRGPMMGGAYFEAIVDGNFILSGLLAWVWSWCVF